jgi:hypothetical protein
MTANISYVAIRKTGMNVCKGSTAAGRGSQLLS